MCAFYFSIYSRARFSDAPFPSIPPHWNRIYVFIVKEIKYTGEKIEFSGVA